MTVPPSQLPHAPGPSPADMTSANARFTPNPLEFLPQLQRAYGDVVRLGGEEGGYLISDPALIEFVHVQTGRLFDKGYLQPGSLMGLVFGNGLVVSEGDFWLRQRRMIQPSFHRDRIRAYGEVMVADARRMLADWQDGQTRDVHQDMMHVTLEIILKSLFDLEAGPEAQAFGQAMDDMLGSITQLYMATPETAPAIQARFEDATRRIDDFTRGVIQTRRAQGGDRGDLLSMLLAAQDDEQRGMTEQQLLDESKNLIMAGHETTSNTLSWTLWLLAQHPEVEAKLHAELDAALAGRPPEVADLERLPYARNVIVEAMRVMPPVWSVGRRARQDLELGGYFVPEGAMLSMSQWVVQRDERFFPDPLAFTPERWEGGLERRIPRYAYFPFGGGPRVCIGENFARMEAVLLLATIAQRYRLHLPEGEVVRPEPSITLRPHGGLHMRLEAR